MKVRPADNHLSLVQTPWMRHRIQLSPLLYLCQTSQVPRVGDIVHFLVLGLDLVAPLHFLIAPNHLIILFQYFWLGLKLLNHSCQPS